MAPRDPLRIIQNLRIVALILKTTNIGKIEKEKTMKQILLIFTCLILFGCVKSNEVVPKELITVVIASPTTLERISNNVEYSFRATPSESVRKIEYFLDGLSIGSATETPYTLKWIPNDMDGGEHLLSVTATSFKLNDFKTEQKIHLRLNIGDDFRGGKIFQLTGVNSGLISSTMDLQSGANEKFLWSASNTLIGANSSNGSENTAKMANASVTELEAGYHFKNGYQYNGYNDWYIPSFDELNMLKENMYYIGGFVESVKNSYYWSSSELSASVAEIQNMTALVGTEKQKGLFAYRIRPIRKF